MSPICVNKQQRFDLCLLYGHSMVVHHKAMGSLATPSQHTIASLLGKATHTVCVNMPCCKWFQTIDTLANAGIHCWFRIAWFIRKQRGANGWAFGGKRGRIRTNKYLCTWHYCLQLLRNYSGLVKLRSSGGRKSTGMVIYDHYLEHWLLNPLQTWCVHILNEW